MRRPNFAAARQFDQIELMRDNLAQRRVQKGSAVDAAEIVDRLLIIAGRRPRVCPTVASSVTTAGGVQHLLTARHDSVTARLQIEELARRAVRCRLALRQMIEFCLTTAQLSGLSRIAGH
jgi:hypothetical protein